MFLNCIKKHDIYHVWRELQFNCKKTQVAFRSRGNNFEIDLDNLFDIALADALERLKMEEDIFKETESQIDRDSWVV